VCHRDLFRCLYNVRWKLCQSYCLIYIYIYITFKDFSDTSSSVLIAARRLNEVKWLSWVKCVYSHLFVFFQLCLCSVQYVVSILFASISYFQITRFMIFNILFVFVFLFVYLFFILCILWFCIVLFIISPFYIYIYIYFSLQFLYKFNEHCHRVEIRLHWIYIIS